MCIGSSASHRCEQGFFLPPENVVRLQCVIVDRPTGYMPMKNIDFLWFPQKSGIQLFVIYMKEANKDWEKTRKYP